MKERLFKLLHWYPLVSTLYFLYFAWERLGDGDNFPIGTEINFLINDLILFRQGPLLSIGCFYAVVAIHCISYVILGGTRWLPWLELSKPKDK